MFVPSHFFDERLRVRQEFTRRGDNTGAPCCIGGDPSGHLDDSGLEFIVVSARWLQGKFEVQPPPAVAIAGFKSLEALAYPLGGRRIDRRPEALMLHLEVVVLAHVPGARGVQGNAIEEVFMALMQQRPPHGDVVEGLELRGFSGVEHCLDQGAQRLRIDAGDGCASRGRYGEKPLEVGSLQEGLTHEVAVTGFKRPLSLENRQKELAPFCCICADAVFGSGLVLSQKYSVQAACD